ncbi:DUF262 domain-containing protein [Desulfococcaceae bacterium HSG7]|nr:DUF262 domain-containing protein [Desulfococcaceae bacterium HSG7]
MENNIIDIKRVSDLFDFGFFIPAYQRGYRWEKQQIEDLLNDISDFTPREIENSKDKTWYCLQPLVIKKCDKITKKKHCLSDKSFEVIDGQQRLTTIYLIGHYINEMWRGKDKDAEIKLSYETREKSSAFLNQLIINPNNEVEIEKSNIDYYHISSAYKTINDWVQGNKNENFHKDNFIDKFLNNTKVIWYESEEIDSIAIFTRINMGKIPLTNAELIKALFLNSSNFKDNDTEKIKLKQLKIANEWDIIEYSLQNPEFWYFINEPKNDLPTRIEFIFDLMANKPIDADEYHTFRYFSKKFKYYNDEEITNNWDEIKQYFQTLEEWFLDRELYHKIGFLVSTGTKIKDWLNFSKKFTKSDFKKKIDAKITEKVNVDIDNLEYGNAQIKRVLLFHNIQSMLNNELENSRFPFDRYKNEKWDIEHIHPVQDEMPQLKKHQKDWLIEASKFIKNDKHLKQKVESFDNDDFEALYIEILNYFSENKTHKDIKNDDDISNLVLLDSGTNRGYKNAVFPVKRKTIIEKDRQGTFIPLCTKNVFMKYYSNEVPQMTFWGEKDRNDYLNDIKKILNPYLQSQNEVE